MGSGSWSSATYAAGAATSRATGKSFGYSRTMSATAPGARHAHETLDPSKKNSAGLNIRESRDSDEHPTSLPLTVMFDETGSMERLPGMFIDKLKGLFSLLQVKGYVEHPQVAVGAYGDAQNNEDAPLQIAQFESDNRIDDALDKIFLEGNGGGNRGETMSLAWYYIATHTATDSWEKRGKKGYAFFIGDECALDINAAIVKRYVGDDQPLCELDQPSLVAKLLETWDAYILVINNNSAQWQDSVAKYTALFGEDRVLIVQDPESIAETIGGCIGLSEGVIDGDDLVADLKEIGATDEAIASATTALAKKTTASGGRKLGTVVTSPTPEGVDESEDSVTRL